MFKLLIFLFIFVPALEVTLLIASSHWIGIGPTFLVIMATGIIGAYLAKQQGVAVLQEIRYRLNRGQMPTDVLLDGLCILVGGILLLTPGYATDMLGFVLLIPSLRKPIKQLVYKWIEKRIQTGTTKIIWK